MTTVWIVGDDNYEGIEIDSVYATKELADLYASRHNLSVIEFEVSTEVPDEVTIWTATGTLNLATGELTGQRVRSEVVLRSVAEYRPALVRTDAAVEELPPAAAQKRYVQSGAVELQTKGRLSKDDALAALAQLAEQARSHVIDGRPVIDA